MNILLFTTDFPQPSDWMRAPFNLHLCAALSANHRVSVVVPCSWYERMRAGGSAAPGGKPEWPDSLFVQYPTFYYTPGVWRSSYESLMSLSTRAAVRKAAGVARPDVVIGYWAYPDGAVASRIARRLDVPYVQMVGGSDVLTCTSGPARNRVARVLVSADRVVAVGQHLRESILGFGVRPSAVSVIPRGIDTRLFSRGSAEEARRTIGIERGGAVLLWVGRMVPVKGLDVLLDASHRLMQSGVDHRLLLVGDGPLRAELQRKSEALGLNVLFRPAVPQRELPDYYRAADVTVLSSRSEGIPNVLRESIACGTPFVATRVGGVAEVARQGVDELVPPHDSESFAHAIRRVLERGRHSGATRSDPLSWAQSAEMLVDVVNGVDREARIA